MDNILGATCPQCGKPVKARKKGACPHCGTALLTYKGRYYREEQGTPTVAILSAFERYASQQISKKQGRQINFHISKKTPQYRRELVYCERLLEACDGSLDTALLILEVAFLNQQFSWKNRSSLASVLNEFSMLDAVAQAVQIERSKKVARNETVANELDGREDVFA